MDVVHFAETHGNDQDRERPNAWPYRDYLIRSFNDDKPYARFVQEQVAGDVLYPDDPQATVALGFLAAGPWDESSQRNIRDDTVDKQAAQNLDRDDMVTTTMSTFASTTVHCARCHDHKFDPISQAEYYGLQAVFAGVDRADRPYDADPKLDARRRRSWRSAEGWTTGRYEPGASPRDDAARERGRPRGRRSPARAGAGVDRPRAADVASANGATLDPAARRLGRFDGQAAGQDTYTLDGAHRR